MITNNTSNLSCLHFWDRRKSVATMGKLKKWPQWEQKRFEKVATMGKPPEIDG